MKVPGAKYPEGAEVREDGAIRFYNATLDKVSWRKPVPQPDGKSLWEEAPDELPGEATLKFCGEKNIL